MYPRLGWLERDLLRSIREVFFSVRQLGLEMHNAKISVHNNWNLPKALQSSLNVFNIVNRQSYDRKRTSTDGTMERENHHPFLQIIGTYNISQWFTTSYRHRKKKNVKSFLFYFLRECQTFLTRPLCADLTFFDNK